MRSRRRACALRKALSTPSASGVRCPREQEPQIAGSAPQRLQAVPFLGGDLRQPQYRRFRAHAPGHRRRNKCRPREWEIIITEFGRPTQFPAHRAVPRSSPRKRPLASPLGWRPARIPGATTHNRLPVNKHHFRRGRGSRRAMGNREVALPFGWSRLRPSLKRLILAVCAEGEDFVSGLGAFRFASLRYGFAWCILLATDVERWPNSTKRQGL